MDMHDIRDFFYNGFQTIKNFFRTIVSAVRGRELSKVDDGTESPIIDAAAKKMNRLEAKLDELEMDIANREAGFKEYVTSKDKSAFVALELAIDIHKTTGDVITLCKKLLEHGENADVTEQLHYFEQLEARYAKIIIALGPKAKQKTLEYAIDLFENEIITEALFEASQISPHYIENFAIVQEHLSAEDDMDKHAWLQKLGDKISMVFNSDFNEYSETFRTYVPRSHFEKMLAQTQLSVDSRTAIRDLVLALNQLLRTYAIDDNYKDIKITVKAMEVDEPTQSTIQELSEHMNEWFEAYKSKFNNEKKPGFINEESKLNLAAKKKPTVRFAAEASVAREFIDDDENKIGQSFGHEKVKFGNKMPYMSPKQLLSKPAVKSTKKRRASTIRTPLISKDTDDGTKPPKKGI